MKQSGPSSSFEFEFERVRADGVRGVRLRGRSALASMPASCWDCGKSKAATDFSASQMKKAAGDRRCEQCITVNRSKKKPTVVAASSSRANPWAIGPSSNTGASSSQSALPQAATQRPTPLKPRGTCAVSAAAAATCVVSSLSLPSSTIGALSAVPPGRACGRAGEPRSSSIGVDDEVPGSRCVGGAGVGCVGCVGCGLTGGGRGGAGAPDPGIGAVPLPAAAPGWPPTRKGIAPTSGA